MGTDPKCPRHGRSYWAEVGCYDCLNAACHTLEEFFREVDRIDAATKNLTPPPEPR